MIYIMNLSLAFTESGQGRTVPYKGQNLCGIQKRLNGRSGLFEAHADSQKEANTEYRNLDRRLRRVEWSVNATSPEYPLEEDFGKGDVLMTPNPNFGKGGFEMWEGGFQKGKGESDFGKGYHGKDVDFGKGYHGKDVDFWKGPGKGKGKGAFYTHEATQSPKKTLAKKKNKEKQNKEQDDFLAQASEHGNYSVGLEGPYGELEDADWSSYGKQEWGWYLKNIVSAVHETPTIQETDALAITLVDGEYSNIWGELMPNLMCNSPNCGAARGVASVEHIMGWPHRSQNGLL